LPSSRKAQAQQGVADLDGQLVGDPRIFAAIPAAMDLRHPERQPFDAVESADQPVERLGQQLRERKALDLAAAKVDLDAVERGLQRFRRPPGMAPVSGADLGD
jgi:hypothetical protein